MARTPDHTRYPNPPQLPRWAMGFLAPRVDRPERYALHRPDGTLSNTFAQHATLSEIAAVCGFRLEMLGDQCWAVSWADA